jgi:23S rRNA (guanine2535-N1)-methyltransferase
VVYRFVVDHADYGDLASGAVLRSAPGFPGFPVRLASEMFQRAAALHDGSGPLTVWDPCCGSGYLLTVIGLLNRERIDAAVATDVSDHAIEIARANLGLLCPDGLAARAGELAALADQYGKQSHRDAVEAAHRLFEGLTGPSPHITTAAASVFDADRLTGPGRGNTARHRAHRRALRRADRLDPWSGD